MLKGLLDRQAEARVELEHTFEQVHESLVLNTGKLDLERADVFFTSPRDELLDVITSTLLGDKCEVVFADPAYHLKNVVHLIRFADGCLHFSRR